MSTQIRPATGTLLISTPLGPIISSAGRGGANFAHPFRGALINSGIRFSKGIVLGSIPHEPTIGGIPISGDAKNPQPILKLNRKGMAGDAIESWACIELTPNEDGSTDKKTKVEVVHRAEPVSTEPKVGRCPLCLIIWNGEVPGKLIAFTMFNLRYYRTTPTAGKGVPRHYFL